MTDRPAIARGVLRRRGFALVVTVSLLVLLTVLSVAMLTLAAISVRASGAGSAMAVARANARLGMILALGELQRRAGPDRRVTGSSSLVSDSESNRHWTGVWDSTTDDSEPVWLVSGDPSGVMDPAVPADTVLVDSEQADGRVSVNRVVISSAVGSSGEYAWWVGDEGVKARVDITAGDRKTTDALERLANAATPRDVGIDRIGEEFEELGPEGEIDRRMLVTAASAEIPTGDNGLLETHFHDITSGGYGLPVNVVSGRMKTDLSRVFDSAGTSSALAEKYLGARAEKITAGGATQYQFTVKAPKKFYFMDELPGAASLRVGPNWGILYNYAQLWNNTGGQSTTNLVPVFPGPQCDIRTNDWPPYRKRDEGSWKKDEQHLNSAVTPVVSLLQMGFRLRARPAVIPGTSPPQSGYQMQLEMKPVVGLWNPYNVKIRSTSYQYDWALYPYLRIGVQPPGQANALIRRFWMRENWKTGDGGGDTPETSQARCFRLRTTSVDLEPGEFRLFSVTSRTNIAETNELVPRWNEEGAFSYDLVQSKFDGGATAGKPLIVPAGSVAWYGDLFLEDAQHIETARQYPRGFEEGASASWFTLKGGPAGEAIHRISDLWVTVPSGQTPPYYIPEQVVSESIRTGITSPKIPVEQLAAVPWHIGTWAWSVRSSTEAVAKTAQYPTQKLRGWADANVRHMAENPAWDGSKLAGNRFEGWYFNAPMIGGSYPGPSYNGHNGTGGAIVPLPELKGRGKIAEGAIGEVEPQTTGDNRYRGYGGPAGTALLGQTHAPIFDVPRGPLVSVGQFQHAQLARYGYEPGFVVGNSYASLRIPLDKTWVDKFNGVADFRLLDISYHANELLWDDYFFSTIGANYRSVQATLNRLFPLDKIASGEQPLPNPRYRFMVRPGDVSMQQIIGDAGQDSPEEIASRIAIDGAFNVNSTSKAAWKATLASLASLEFPVINTAAGAPTWDSADGARLPRFGHVFDAAGWQPGGDSDAGAFWRGFRKLSAEELDQLAEAIVREVKERGPFRSFAGFVNRDPGADDSDHQLKGALQAALDETLNNQLPETIGGHTEQPHGSKFSKAADGESEAVGAAGYLMQGDLLQALAPVLSVRSDYFRIRATGAATDPRGVVTARAYCEALVQRSPGFVDPGDPPKTRLEDLKRESNRRFGRRYKLVSFRWLTPAEI